MSEVHLKRRVIKALKQNYTGCFIWKIADRFRIGMPDLLFIWRGKHIFIELKTPKGKITKIQQYTIDKINQAGGYACVCRSVEDAMIRVEKVMR